MQRSSRVAKAINWSSALPFALTVAGFITGLLVRLPIGLTLGWAFWALVLGLTLAVLVERNPKRPARHHQRVEAPARHFACRGIDHGVWSRTRRLISLNIGAGEPATCMSSSRCNSYRRRQLECEHSGTRV